MTDPATPGVASRAVGWGDDVAAESRELDAGRPRSPVAETVAASPAGATRSTCAAAGSACRARGAGCSPC